MGSSAATGLFASAYYGGYSGVLQLKNQNSYIAVRTQPRVRVKPELDTQMRLIRPFSFSLLLLPSRVVVEQRTGGTACHAIGKRVENDRTPVAIGTVDEIG